MPNSKTSSSNSSSQTVFDILRELSRSDRPLGVAELHRIVDEPTSSTHRALMTLEESGLASRFGRQIKFGPGPMVQHIVRAMIARFEIRKKGVPLLSRISELTEAPVTLNAKLGWYSVRVGWVEGHHELYDQRRIGQARLLHEPVAPAMMLSTLPDSQIQAYREFVAKALPDVTADANSAEVDKMIKLGRIQGFLVKDDPRRPEGCWVSFPVRNAEGNGCGALTLAMEKTQLPGKGSSSEMMDKVAELIQEFQTHLDENPAETMTPYDYLPNDDIRLTLSRETLVTTPAVG